MKTELPYLSREENRHGNECLFVRRHGKRIRIREQEGTPAFAKAYTEALDKLAKPLESDDRERKAAAKSGTMGWLAARYFAESEEFKKLYKKSQQARRSCIEDCLREPRVPGSTDLIRDCPVSQFTAAHVKMLRDRKAKQPGAANNRRKHLSAMCSWAVEANLMPMNYVRDIKSIQTASGGFHTWTVPEVERYPKRHPIGTRGAWRSR